MGYQGIRRYQKCWQRSWRHYTTMFGMILYSDHIINGTDKMYELLVKLV